MPPTSKTSSHGSRVIVETIESAALRGNALGDPHIRPLPIYLPPGYDADESRYATVYLLAAYMATGAMEMNEGLWQETLHQRMDRLITSGKIPPMIVVMPDMSTRYGGSQYINSSATGRYGDHLLEIVQLVDERFRTRADRDYRALMGKSSGGYGAMVHGMQRPDVFSMVADHSGDKGFDYSYRNELPKFLQACARGGDLAELLRDPGAQRLRLDFETFFYMLDIPAMSACYSPSPEAPLGFDLPVDLNTCELNEAVWERWLQNDPIHMVREHADALRSLRLLYFDCGSKDEFNLQFGCRILVKRLKELGIKHRYEEFNAGHRLTQLYRYDVSLEAIGKALPG